MDAKTFEQLCELSKLDFTEEEKPAMISGINDIIELAEIIKDFNLEYDDTKDMNEVRLDDLREDICLESFPVEKLMQNTRSQDNCYVIPKMME